MPVYDLGVSAIENYTCYCNQLKDAARTLASYVTPSKINHNGRMASDEMIERQIQIVNACAHMVETMEKQLGIKPDAGRRLE